uniref:Uncharacterized protein n=1 Tax=uncultured Rhodospirillales bacterium HF0200_01O14 TaxID=710787 RepID=E0XTW5_9PROT|nr:hypothetical protein [uncultured Rhodospirillales bacterium HF0200_01O14]
MPSVDASTDCISIANNETVSSLVTSHGRVSCHLVGSYVSETPARTLSDEAPKCPNQCQNPKPRIHRAKRRW